MILKILNDNNDPTEINHTYITLVPKMARSEVAKDFRPISLCNVVMKIVSKCIANRMKIVLPHLIGETQSAFAPGRLITDNALIAFKAFHYMKPKKRGRKG